jgi:hypothetical protein
MALAMEACEAKPLKPNHSERGNAMLSQIEAPQTRTTVLGSVPTTVSISTAISGNSVIFTVTSGTGVTVDPSTPSMLWASPGVYDLVFTLASGNAMFDTPALSVVTPFGSISQNPQGSTSVTLPNTNQLSTGDGDQLFSFSMSINGSIFDPTLVNTADPT